MKSKLFLLLLTSFVLLTGCNSKPAVQNKKAPQKKLTTISIVADSNNESFSNIIPVNPFSTISCNPLRNSNHFQHYLGKPIVPEMKK